MMLACCCHHALRPLLLLIVVLLVRPWQCRSGVEVWSSRKDSALHFSSMEQWTMTRFNACPWLSCVLLDLS